MLTALTLTNFKAFGERQRIEFAPITLLFGPNGGGKSSILHALHYARELLLRGNADAEFTESGGEQVELGGFRTLLHKNPIDNPASIQIGLEFVVEGDLPEIGALSKSTLQWLEDSDVLGEISSAIQTAKIELTVDRLPDGGAYVSEYRVDVNGKCIGALYAHAPTDDHRHDSTLELWPHQIFSSTPWKQELPAELMCVSLGTAEFVHGEAKQGTVYLHLPFRLNACPEWNEVLKTHFPSESAVGDPEAAAGRELLTLIATRIFVGLGQILTGILEPFRYIGPIRKVPGRTRTPRTPIGPSKWADGLAAWEAMEQNTELLHSASDWLVGHDLLDAGYWLTRAEEWEINPTELRGDRALKMVDDGLEETIASLKSTKRRGMVVLMDEMARLLHPRDVGIGYSQMIPVIAACLDTKSSLVAVEQPELHIHPRLQVRMGDLFIHAAIQADKPKFVILETHSEHLLLRLLRRVRESQTTSIHSTKALSPSDLGVYYIKYDQGISSSLIRPLRVDKDGEFMDPWPNGFFDERGKELFS